MKFLLPFCRANLVLVFSSILFSTSLANASTTLLIKYKKASSGNFRSHFSNNISGIQKPFLSDPQTSLFELDPNTNIQEAIEEIRKNPEVEYVEQDEVISAHSRPNDSHFSEQWALESNNSNIGAEKAWDVITNSTAILIAIVDSGCNYSHEDLKDNIWRNPSETPNNRVDDDRNGYVDDYNGYDFQNNDADPLDDFEHGSLVSGIIAASGNNDIGISGISWNSKIMCLKVLDSVGNSTISKAVEAIDFAIFHGAKVINMSWGYVPSASPSRTLEEAILRAQAAGVLVVASAGNGTQGFGYNNDENINLANYPSSYPQDNIIAVAATDPSDRLTAFSNYGARTVDLGAPGISILSTHPTRGYSFFTGTSAAAPHVSGTVALVWALNPNLHYSEIKRLVIETGDAMPTLSGKSLSGTRLNISNAINASPAAGGHLLESPSPLSDGNGNSISTNDDDSGISSQSGGCQLSVNSRQTNPAYLFILILGTLIFWRMKKAI